MKPIPPPRHRGYHPAMSLVDYQIVRIIATGLGVAFAAFCVWLAVRIMNRRERWAKRLAAIVVGAPVLYALSFGPACWLNDWGLMPDRGFGSTYTPLLACAAQSSTACDAAVWYGKLLSPSWKKQGATAGSLAYQAKDDWLPHSRLKKPRRN
ncbi:MAG TPA: hypothetical protein VGM05_01245 [Planctomycetaceae bacterium]